MVFVVKPVFGERVNFVDEAALNPQANMAGSFGLS